MMNQRILVPWRRDFKYIVESFDRHQVDYDIVSFFEDDDRSVIEGSRAKNKIFVNGPLLGTWTPAHNEKFRAIWNPLLEKNRYDYILPLIGEGYLHLIADYNTKHNLTGIKSDILDKVQSKNVYYKIMSDLGLSVPRTYLTVKDGKIPALEILSDSDFPVIAKPNSGAGGHGVKVFYHREDLFKFFLDWEIDPDYQSIGRGYVIQQFVAGDVVCVAGHVSQGKVSLDLVYEIESQRDDRYCSEVGYAYPGKYQSLKRPLLKDLEIFLKLIGLDNNPFMMNLIVDRDGKYHIIDFGARICISTSQIMYHLGFPDYVFSITNKFLNEIDFSCPLEDKHYLLRHFDLSLGIIKSASGDATLAAELSLPPPGHEIKLSSNDTMLTSQKAYTVVTGNSFKETEEKFCQIEKSLKIEYR